MSSLLDVNSTDLKLWAARRDAQGVLPQLIRRLVNATVERVAHSDFPSGDAVQTGGWDGIVECEVGNEFVPSGTSVWELSVEKGSKGKADRDYEKRTSNTLGIDPSKATFVFATPRLWSNADAWVKNRCQEGTWRDVIVHNASRLEQWLEQAPVVHLWFSSLLGKHRSEAVDFDSYWLALARTTKPQMTPGFMLAGRQEVVSKVHSWIDNPEIPLVVRGESREDSVAFLAAALLGLEPGRRDALLSRAVLVHDRRAWDQLAAGRAKLLLCASFDCDQVSLGRAMQQGHSVVLPRGRADSESQNAIDIPRLSPELVAIQLAAAGVEQDAAQKLASLAGRSTTAFRRKISISPELEQPEWSHPEHARTLLPALLANRWSDNTEGDREALAALAGKPYEEFQAQLIRWANEHDPPVRCTGSIWYLIAEEDSWLLLGRYLTSDDIDQFHNLAVEVFQQANPAFSLPDRERWTASIFGAMPQHSDSLRTGLAHTLAFAGARGCSKQIADGSSLDAFVGRSVREILKPNDWRVWASLPLSLLAEAAPDEFLDAVDRGLSGERPFLAGLFRDKEADMSASSPHIALLQALEVLAWNEQLLVRVAASLTLLDRIDPGGTWLNRPLASLTTIFLLWWPQTSASLDRRFEVLNTLRSRHGDIGWRLMKSLLPKRGGSSSPNAQPRWREWAIGRSTEADPAEHVQAIDRLLGIMLKDVGTDGTRWSDLIKAVPQLPHRPYEAVVTQLESLDLHDVAPEGSVAICDSLRSLVSDHRSFDGSDWALPVQEVDRLAAVLSRFKPQDAFARYGWLFSRSPRLPEGRGEDWKVHEQTVMQRRCEAVEALVDSCHLDWIPELVESVEAPATIGLALGRSECAETLTDELLGIFVRPENHRYLDFLSGFAGNRVREAGFAWARQALERVGSDWSSANLAAFCLCLPFNSETWTLVDTFEPDAVREYWNRVYPICVEAVEIEFVTKKLLEVERAGVAANVIGLHLRKSCLPPELLLSVLEQLASKPPDKTEFRRVSGQYLAKLLRYVAEANDVDESRVAKLEWAFLPVLQFHYTPKLLVCEMAKEPEFFARVVELVYRAEGEEASEPTAEEQARAERAYDLLEAWRGRPLPGIPEGSVFDAKTLETWVAKARQSLGAMNRLAIGEHTIGKVLSSVSGGDDNAWPHPAIRELVETLRSEDFEEGLLLGHLNTDRVYTKAADSGGAREHGIADTYERQAEMVSAKWGRTATLLRRLAADYRARARDEDQRLQLREELSP